ncbi:MAG: NUDIX hydrolase [Candidatus Shapirobacteria bacterium]
MSIETNGDSNSVEWRGHKYDYEWIDGTNINNFKPYTLVSGVCFNKEGKILIMNEHGRWRFPGGQSLSGSRQKESPENTLIREVKEETNVLLKNDRNTLLGAYKVKKVNSKKPEYYQIYYFSEISQILLREKDPENQKILGIEFVDTKNLLGYLHWGEEGTFLLKAIIKEYNKRQNNQK